MVFPWCSSRDLVVAHQVELFNIFGLIGKFLKIFEAYVVYFKVNWDDHLPLIDFTYNNNYHSSIGMTLYEALCGRRCWSLIGWYDVSEVSMKGPELVHEVVDKYWKQLKVNKNPLPRLDRDI